MDYVIHVHYLNKESEDKEKMSSRRLNGFGTLISKGKGKPYLAKWVYKGKVYYKSTGESDKKRALKVLEKLTRPYREEREEDVLRNLQNRLVSLQETRTREKLLTEEIWNAFEKTLRNRDIKQTTKNLYKSQLDGLSNWMKSKAKYAEDITAEMCADYMEVVNACPSSWNLQLSLFRRVWKALGAEFNLKADVWNKFTNKRVSKKSTRRAVDDDEIHMMLENAKTKDMKLLITTGLYTGLRISDCAMLKWESVDFENAMLHVVPIKTEKFSSEPLDIPIHPTLLNVLKSVEHTSEYVSEENASAWKWRRSQLSQKIVRLFKSCGIKTSEVDENGRRKSKVSFHSLRHYFVSNAINNGMSPMLVSKIVGHSSLKMTDRYFHESIDKVREGINSLPDVM